MQINLRHVTAIVDSGLALLTNREDAPYQLLTEISCDNSIFASRAKPPLVEQRGSDSIDEYQARLEWSGDHDFFDGFEVFWQIAQHRVWHRLEATCGSTTGRPPGAVAAAGRWRAPDAVVWRRLPPASQPFHSQVPLDYQLDSESAENPAVAGASDGTDAGCMVNQLPRPPGDEASETKALPRLFSPPPRNLDGS